MKLYTMYAHSFIMWGGHHYYVEPNRRPKGCAHSRVYIDNRTLCADNTVVLVQTNRLSFDFIIRIRALGCTRACEGYAKTPRYMYIYTGRREPQRSDEGFASATANPSRLFGVCPAERRSIGRLWLMRERSIIKTFTSSGF